jgi:hypothetical protein
MILVRDVFQLKFGKAREALTVWKEGFAITKKLGLGGMNRLLTDLVGKYYTVVLESTYDSLSDYEKAGKAVTANEEWRAWYQKIVALTEAGHREIFNIVE